METLLSVPNKSRMGRYPRHEFNTESLPFTTQLIAFAPVMPGETLKNLYLESRVVTDPVLNPIIGWKKEYLFYYVRISDLMQSALRDMFVDPANVDLAATLGIAANDQQYYTAKGGIDYPKRAVKRIVETFFRDQDETADQYKTADERFIVQFKKQLWLDSLTDKDLMPEGGLLSGATDAADLQRLMNAFDQLRALNIANMTYEDWLRMNGIAIPDKDTDKPEELAYFSDFVYPANTIDPSNGTPRSAVSWVFKNSMSKPKFFREPGFIVGLSVTRPKVYFSGLAGNATSHLSRAWDWSPNYLWSMPEVTLKNFAGDTGPLGDRTTAPDGYFLDMRDIFLYGDQFQNHTAFNAVPADNGNTHMVALPTGDTFRWKYPNETQCKQFFVTPASGTVNQDGYVNLHIDGTMVDHTVGQLADR
jgi:hypothetical protein